MLSEAAGGAADGRSGEGKEGGEVAEGKGPAPAEAAAGGGGGGSGVGPEEELWGKAEQIEDYEDEIKKAFLAGESGRAMDFAFFLGGGGGSSLVWWAYWAIRWVF